MHVHAVKGDAECKYWLHPDRFDIVEDFEDNCTPRLRNAVLDGEWRKIGLPFYTGQVSSLFFMEVML
jgi:hypothetical protein